MQKINIGNCLMLMLSISCFLWSCKKDNDNPTPAPSPVSEITTVSGKVTDASGNPLAGVTVSAGNKSATSSINGLFTISSADASSGRIVVKGFKTGYFDAIKALIPEKNSITKIELVLLSATTDYSGNSTQSAAFVTNGTGIEIPANSVSGNGNFNAAIEHISPDNPDFERLVPGGDLVATDASNNERMLYSYGMLMVRLTDDAGNEINLANGKTATIRMKISTSQLATAPASIPLWHLDENTGKWREEGSATKQGDQYVGTVSHFSSWNCDLPEGRSTIQGIVKDCKGNPLEGIRVRTGQKSVFTNASGQYQTYVPSGTAFDVAVEYPELGMSSAPVSVNPIAEGATHNVPEISVACPSRFAVNLGCSTGNLFSNYNISWGQGAGQSVFGSFNGTGMKYLCIPSTGQNATYTFQNTLTGQTVSGSFSLPVQLDTFDRGMINLCGDTTTVQDLGVSFIINGDGFINQQVAWNGTTLTSFLIYNTSDSVSVFSSINPSGLFLSGSMSGTPRTGLFTLDDDAAISITMPGGKSYFPDSLFSMNILQFGNPGQKVSGTFNGRFVRVDSSGNSIPVTISSGSFNVFRRPNE